MVGSIGMRRGLINRGDWLDGLERQGSNPWPTTKQSRINSVVECLVANENAIGSSPISCSTIQGDHMWVLVISLFSVLPGNNTSSGSIQAKFASREECMIAREQVLKTVRIDSYRVNAGCVFLK